MTAPFRRPESEGVPASLPFTLARAFVWMIGSFFVMVLGAVIYLAIDPDAGSDLVGLGIVSAASFLLMSAFLISRYPGGAHLSEPLGARASHPLAILIGLLMGLAAKIPAEQLNSFIERLAPRSAEETARFAELFRAESSLHAAALLVVIAVLVPISEEIFFRGGSARMMVGLNWKSVIMDKGLSRKRPLPVAV
jgi:membrane protease YdiL (CAAX protease family)